MIKRIKLFVVYWAATVALAFVNPALKAARFASLFFSYYESFRPFEGPLATARAALHFTRRRWSQL